MTDRISEIRARCDAATPGPWKVDRRLDGVPTVFNESERVFDTFRADGQSTLNAEFCAYARTDIPYLLDRITALETEKAELLKQIVALAGETVRETEVAREEINRLAAYKDTGLEPEEVARFAQAIRDAPCARLPCEVGGMICMSKKAWLAYHSKPKEE